jgi:periplasmic protein TonB
MKKIILSLLFVLPLLAIGQVDSVEMADSIAIENDEVFQFSEVMPEFIDGDIQAFIAKNVVYPKDAQKKGIQGKVMARFVIEKDGSTSNIEIVKGIGYGCDEEVERVVKLMKFTPAMQKGKAVRVRIAIPVNFKLK